VGTVTWTVVDERRFTLGEALSTVSPPDDGGVLAPLPDPVPPLGVVDVPPLPLPELPPGSEPPLLPPGDDPPLLPPPLGVVPPLPPLGVVPPLPPLGVVPPLLPPLGAVVPPLPLDPWLLPADPVPGLLLAAPPVPLPGGATTPPVPPEVELPRQKVAVPVAASPQPAARMAAPKDAAARWDRARSFRADVMARRLAIRAPPVRGGAGGIHAEFHHSEFHRTAIADLKKAALDGIRLQPRGPHSIQFAPSALHPGDPGDDHSTYGRTARPVAGNGAPARARLRPRRHGAGIRSRVACARL